MKKNLVTLLLALAIVSPTATVTSFAAGEAEVINEPIKEVTAAKQNKLESRVIKNESDIEEITDENTVIIGKDKLESGDRVVVNTYHNIVVVTEDKIDIDEYYKNTEEGIDRYTNSENNLALNIGEKTEIVDLEGNKISKDTLDGKVLVVYYDITTRSIPAQTTPSKIVVVSDGTVSEKAEESVLTDIFVKSNDFGEYIDKNNTLALNISDETIIVDENGNKVSKDDLHLKTLEVHYNFATMSIPAQTTPSKIIVKNVPAAQPGDFTKPAEKENIAVFIKGEKTYSSEYKVNNEKNYVPLRAAAEGIGIIVKWSGEDGSIILESDDIKKSIKVADNDDLFIEEGSTFVMAESLNKYFNEFGVTIELK